MAIREYMTGRERVLATVAHQRVDRIAMNYIAAPGVTARLIERLGVADAEGLLDALHIDMRRIGHWRLWPSQQPDGAGYVRSLFGLRTRANANGPTGSAVVYPFDEDTTVDDVHAHGWPDPDHADFSGIREECERFAGNYATYGSPWCPFFHEVGWLLGQDTFLVWMHTKPDVVHAVIDHIVDYEVEVTRRFLEACNGKLDIAYFGNDFGTQRNLLISPQLWVDFIRPPLKRFFDLAHDYGCKVMQHSCGAIRPLIPMFTEDGVDILDPLQTGAEGMAFDGLARDFAKSIALHGGVDIQHVLPFGSAAEVRAQVRSYINATANTGGYVLMGSQKLIDDIPDDNVLAMYDEPLGG